jgi:hypothetical protein
MSQRADARAAKVAQNGHSAALDSNDVKRTLVTIAAPSKENPWRNKDVAQSGHLDGFAIAY